MYYLTLGEIPGCYFWNACQFYWLVFLFIIYIDLYYSPQVLSNSSVAILSFFCEYIAEFTP
jgi:hypothetical protein